MTPDDFERVTDAELARFAKAPNRLPSYRNMVRELIERRKLDAPDSIFDRARVLLGKQVVVKISTTGIELVRGKLLALDEWGEVVIEDDMGGLHFCWPLLDIEASE